MNRQINWQKVIRWIGKGYVVAATVAMTVVLLLFGLGLRADDLVGRSVSASEGSRDIGSVPSILNYDGYVTDSLGLPFNGNHDITVRIYDSIAPTMPLWTEQHTNVAVENGYFSLYLGDVTPLNEDLFDAPNRFVGITIGINDEMAPRQRLATVPYAIQAHSSVSAEHAVSADSADFALSATQAISATFASESPFPQPDFDSGWFTMQSQQGIDSYKEISHTLGIYPSNVKVFVRPIDGPNQGYIFEGVGSAQANDNNGRYQGIVFAYNEDTVRLWAPDKRNTSDIGAIAGIEDGWGGEINAFRSHIAEVRVLAWR